MNEPLREALASLMLDANALEAVARAFDIEDAAQRGEPDPWDSAEEAEDNEWYDERLGCALAALEALSVYWARLGIEADERRGAVACSRCGGNGIEPEGAQL